MKDDSDKCYFHKTFGADAKKCRIPCKWNAVSTQKGRQSGNDDAGGK